MITEILKISVSDEDFSKKISCAAEIIKRHGLVVFPTETVYGLGADGTSAEAARKIYMAKGRPSDNPLIIHIATPEDAERYTYTCDTYYKIAEKFMPGPITVVLPARENIPKETRGGLTTVAVRCPENIIARELIKASGVPIAAPSANLSGSPSPTKPEHVILDLNGRVDMIIDGGECDFGLESTIVKIEDDGGVLLLRPGKITPDDLLNVISYVKIAPAVTDELKNDEVAISPGMKYRHYAPRAPLYLIDSDNSDKTLSYLEEKGKNKKIAVIVYNELLNVFSKIPGITAYPFGYKDDELTQAHLLFDLLRQVDKLDFDEIYAPLPKKQGLGLALYNRMIRAAAHHIIRM